MLSILCAAGLVCCVIAILLTIVLTLLKKKAKLPLALYAMAILLILGAEFALADSMPAPDRPQSSGSTRVSSQQAAAPRSVPAQSARQRSSGRQTAAAPAESDVPDAPEDGEPEAASSVGSSTQPSAKKRSAEPEKESASPVYDAAPMPAIAAPKPTADTEPALEEGAAAGAMQDRALAGDPVLAPMNNPALTGDPEPAPMDNPSFGGGGSAANGSQNAQTIYITPTGKHYHYDNSCNGGTYIASSLEEAESLGLTPCDKCVK